MGQFLARLDGRPIRAIAVEQRRDDWLGRRPGLLDLLAGGLCAGASDRARMALDQSYLLATTTAPIQLYLFPLYFGFAHLGLINNVFALSLIYTAIYSPFAILLLRTYFLAVPKELEEAALVDGANRWQVFSKIAAADRLARHPDRGADHRPQFLERIPDRHDLPAEGRQQTAVVRFYLLCGQYSCDWGEIMAAALLIVAPVVVPSC